MFRGMEPTKKELDMNTSTLIEYANGLYNTYPKIQTLNITYVRPENTSYEIKKNYRTTAYVFGRRNFTLDAIVEGEHVSLPMMSIKELHIEELQSIERFIQDSKSVFDLFVAFRSDPEVTNRELVGLAFVEKLK